MVRILDGGGRMRAVRERGKAVSERDFVVFECDGQQLDQCLTYIRKEQVGIYNLYNNTTATIMPSLISIYLTIIKDR